MLTTKKYRRINTQRDENIFYHQTLYFNGFGRHSWWLMFVLFCDWDSGWRGGFLVDKRADERSVGVDAQP